MCNPKVQLFLHFYPEDSGPTLEEAQQGQCWLNKVKPEELTSMICVKSHNYFIYKPTLLANGSCCIPFQWFTYGGAFYTQAWGLEDTQGEWIVHEGLVIEVLQEMLLKNFCLFRQTTSFLVSHIHH